MVDTTSNRIRGDPPTMQPYCIIDIQNSGRLGKKLKSWNCREKLSLKDHNVTSVRADYLRKAVKQFSQQPKRAIQSTRRRIGRDQRFRHMHVDTSRAKPFEQSLHAKSRTGNGSTLGKSPNPHCWELRYHDLPLLDSWTRLSNGRSQCSGHSPPNRDPSPPNRKQVGILLIIELACSSGKYACQIHQEQSLPPNRPLPPRQLSQPGQKKHSPN